MSGIPKAACIRCRRSKKKCDGKQPCSVCVARKEDCLYPTASRRGPKRRADEGEVELCGGLRCVRGFFFDTPITFVVCVVFMSHSVEFS